MTMKMNEVNNEEFFGVMPWPRDLQVLEVVIKGAVSRLYWLGRVGGRSLAQLFCIRSPVVLPLCLWKFICIFWGLVFRLLAYSLGS